MKRLLLALVLCLAGVRAEAQCAVVQAANVAFGNVASTSVNTTVQPSSTANAGLRCSGALLSLLRTDDFFKLTLTPLGGSTGMVGPTGDVILYTIYADNTTSYPITRGQPFDFARHGILEALGLLGSIVPSTVPLYVKTLTGSNVAAGTYQETFSVYWDWDYCYGIGVLGACIGRQVLTGTTSMTVSLQVTADCQITTPTINFGTAPVVSGFSTVSQSVSLSCTKGSAYTVGLNDGLYVSGGRRRMKSTANNYLSYDIFKSATAVRWGSLTTARRSSSDADINPGNGTGTGSQVFNYNAKVYTDQPTPPAAAYQDSVILDVQF
ncbi:spore coat protein U domain-containing protein [Pseudomonas sp. 20P_3.2_Bac5]|uniref:Csu type fimbrial protein n=1 Tax=unclassified Pseudomonas TaxID=196821 RepID=UPI003965AA66